MRRGIHWVRVVAAMLLAWSALACAQTPVSAASQPADLFDFWVGDWDLTWTNEDGTTGLWRDPELGLGLKWRAERHPTEAWARRYDDSFGRAMRFLEDSERERDRLVYERRAERRRQWRRLQWVAAALALLLFLTGVTAWVATRESQRARAESARAERNLQLARTAVDESLLVVERDPSRLGVDVPEIVGFRRELLEKAQRFYLDFIRQAPQSEDLQREIAVAQLRLGHIDRALDAPDRAVADYQAAVKAFTALGQAYPDRPEYRGQLADAYNWLGEALRRSGGRYAEAKSSYDTALELYAKAYELVPQPTLLFNMASDGLVWASVTETTNPKELQSFVSDLARATIKEMQKQGLAKAQKKGS